MWNIRSHACRFPVHTGTLTPSIAHPNRFLNHLKRFSAGFLTFKGGKIKKHMVLGAESTIWNARRACFRWKRRCGGKGLRMRWNPLSHGLRRASSPERGSFSLSGGKQSKTSPLRGRWHRAAMTERVHAVRNSPSHLALLDASPLWDGALGMTAKFPDKSQSPPYRKGRLPSQSRLTPCQLPRRGSLFVANRQILKSSPFGGAGKPAGFD